MSSSRRSSSEKSSSQETVRTSRQILPRKQERSRSHKHTRATTPEDSPPYSPRIPKTTRAITASDSEDSEMTSSSKSHSSSSKKHSSSSSKSKSSKSDNWTDVMEPEERRRIQNRLAQRKFREKAKDHKEKSERDARNQEFAGSTYSIPAANELLDDNGECSGLPWGSISMQHVARYHESQGSRNSGGSGHGDYVRSSNAYGQYLGYDTEQRTSPSYQSYGSHDNSSGGDFFDDTTYYYNADYDTTQ